MYTEIESANALILARQEHVMSSSRQGEDKVLESPSWRFANVEGNHGRCRTREALSGLVLAASTSGNSRAVVCS